MRLPPSSAAWRMAACRRTGSAPGSGRAAAMVASTRARHCAKRAKVPGSRKAGSGIVAGAAARERLRRGRILGVAEDAHAQLGLFQSALAAAVEADAGFVRLQRFLQAHVSVLHLLDELFQRI